MILQHLISDAMTTKMQTFPLDLTILRNKVRGIAHFIKGCNTTNDKRLV